MRILIIPELREKQITDMRMSQIETNLYRTIKKLSIANLASWSAFAPELETEETTLDLLTRGYFALSQSPTFLSYDVYIGFLLKEDFERVDLIIYDSVAAKEIYETRFAKESLPEADETIVITGEMSVENEVYKRATRYH